MNAKGDMSTFDDNQMSVDDEEHLPTLTSGFTIFQMFVSRKINFAILWWRTFLTKQK